MRNPFENWRTTSSGLTGVAGGVLTIVYAVKKGIADASIWMIGITQIVNGLGLIFARDGAASAKDRDQTKNAVADLQDQVSSIKGDTSTTTKPA